MAGGEAEECGELKGWRVEVSGLEGVSGQSPLDRQAGSLPYIHMSRESVYSVYTVENQQSKCLHKSLHFLQSVYIIVSQ